MKLIRQFSIPAIILLLVSVPVCWGFPGTERGWHSTGIVLGWAGCGLLLACLLLMLREARLAGWLGGLERMYRWHHGAGTAAYLLLLAHPLLLAFNLWQESPALAWQSLSPLSESPSVWLGWVALLLLMAGLAATFAVRLPYRTWRRLHALLGAGVIIGLMHTFLLLGSDAALLTVALLAMSMLAWRLLRIDLGRAARPYLVSSVQPVAREMVEIALSPLTPPIPVKAGQFVLVAFQRGSNYQGCGEFHPFTVSAVDGDGQMRISVKALGDCTNRIQAMVAGVAARVQGPFGVFLAERPETPQLWVAGGIGIAPFLSLLRSGQLRQPVHLLYLYRHAADAAFLPELQALAAADPLLTLQALAAAAETENLAAMLAAAGDPGGRECYLCGPPGLVAAISRLLGEQGVTAEHIHHESFDFR